MAQESPDNDKENKSDAALREEKVLDFWLENQVFQRSLEKSSPKGEFVFYDGPPFATGLPHHGHFLGSVAKDLFGRYKTMRGYHVRRRWGWDCHGLPIENMVEKELGLKTKKDIEKIGIEKFNESCRSAVLRYAGEWEKYINRIGRWVEYENSYKTMDNSYMESVWWALKSIHKKGLLYEGRKVLLYCPHCETPLAKAEVAMDNSYKDITEEAVTLKFKLKPGQAIGNAVTRDNHDVSLLAWTTTPWTLPGNVALAVGTDIDYVVVSQDRETFILASDLYKEILDTNTKPDFTLKGSELVGLEYEPLFDLGAVKQTGKKSWYVTDADFVTTEEGTGVVHTAVIYGEDDYDLGLREDLPMVPLLDATGTFNEKAPEIIQGKYFKDSEEFIIKDLLKRDLLFASAPHTHSYPHCHRCDTQLLYNALTSWFIDIQKVKNRLVKLNNKVNWVPEHLKEGRFLNILKNAPDWTISRNRYWASPLPIWRCSDCENIKVVGGVEDLTKLSRRSDNRYFVMRHGGAESNLERRISTKIENEDHLTEEGKQEVLKSAGRLKRKGIDRIYCSPLMRTKETADIVAKELGLDKSKIVYDSRIRELDAGKWDGRTWDEYHNKFTIEEQLVKAPPGGETRMDVIKRAGEFLYELEEKHSGENVLIITHGAVVGTLHMTAMGAHKEKRVEVVKNRELKFKTAEFVELPFTFLPHNKEYALDLHRPYIDEVVLKCSCGADMKRVPEVVDGWLESGSMPFAEYHFPFENQKVFKKMSPGDFVAEYIAQTRTWFYYMHAMAGMLFGKISFKNVVTTGTILAEDGSKMSKSKRNYTDPLLNLDRYGADALRYYLMTSVVMRAEDVRFTDEELREVHNRLVNILWNVYRFYRTYASGLDGSVKPQNSKNVLDRWILSRLGQLKREMTDSLDSYDTVAAGRPVRDFISDFSTWYLRRSRERFKGEDESDKQFALATTRYVLLESSKLIAPLMPFLAESIYKGVEGDEASVHLDKWPEPEGVDEKLVADMKEVRDTVSLALEERSTAGVKVRQPLKSLIVRHPKSEVKDDESLLALIRDEVNVKEVVFEDSTGWEVELDLEITADLKEEGDVRELIRNVQILRKKSGLTPNDRANLLVSTGEAGRGLIEKFEDHLKSAALLDEVSISEVSSGHEVKIGENLFTVSLKK